MLEFFCDAASTLPAPSQQTLRQMYQQTFSTSCLKQTSEDIVVDCANGAGFETIKLLLTPDEIKDRRWQLANTEGQVNHLCGSDHVCSAGAPPPSFPAEGRVGASFDGDADRLVIYRTDGKSFELINGDKAAGLCGLFIKSCLAHFFDSSFACAVVTTNYSDTATRDFIQSLGLKWVVCPVGFKHLEAAAHSLSVAILFESNGHFKFKVSREFYAHVKEQLSESQRQLLEFLSLNKHADAVLNLMAFTSIKEELGMTWADVSRLFSFKEASNYKLKVGNRYALVADEVTGVVATPADVQQFMENLCIASKTGLRIYIRPSGTEDVLRVLVEGTNSEEIQAAREAFDAFILSHPSLNPKA